MDMNTILYTIVLGVLPISELRGAIPYGYLHGLPLLWATIIGTASNLLVSPLVFLFLSSLHKVLYAKLGFYRRIFDKTLVRVRMKISRKVELYGFLGILLFVGIPFPVTGAWTGTLGAWVLGLDRKKSLLAVSGGVLMSSTIVTLIIYLGKGASSLFVKIM